MKASVKLIGLAILAAAMFSCSTPRLTYFQGVQDGQVASLTQSSAIRLRPYDKISIVVNAKDAELASLFNLPIYTNRVGSKMNSSYNSSLQLSAYTLDADGNIDFPFLGEVHVSGLTRNEVASKIKSELISKNLVKDPVVIAEFVDLAFSVIGEVKSPGHFNIDKNETTILQAISMAGDLTINGERKNVLVQRKEGDKVVNYRLDLTSLDDIALSPAFYIQQDDVIYVAPSKKRQREATVNGNNVLSTSFWVSLTTLAITVVNFVLGL